MRFSLLIVLSMTIAACSHQPEKAASQAQSTVAVMPATYAASMPSNGAKIPPSSPCAENFDNIVSHLEGLMQKTASAAPQ